MRTQIILVLALLTLPTACKKTSSSSGGQSASAVAVSAPSAPPAVTQRQSRPKIYKAPAKARSDELWSIGQQGLSDLSQVCTRGAQGGERQASSVTHYYIAPGAKVGDYRCRNGLAYFGQPAMAGTCLLPCRALAADPRYHRPGEVIFFRALVGMTCGSGRDKMIHDGFMVVTDNGNPEAINTEGRFGLFWGRCSAEQNGFCLDEGAVGIDFALTFSNYCRAWRPADPTFNDDIKLAVYNAVRSEAVRRGDNHAASKFDLDAFVGLTVNPSGQIIRRFNPAPEWNPFSNGN